MIGTAIADEKADALRRLAGLIEIILNPPKGNVRRLREGGTTKTPPSYIVSARGVAGGKTPRKKSKAEKARDKLAEDKRLIEFFFPR